MGTRGYVLLIVVALVVFVWQVFMALFVGGAFFTAMDDSPSRSWTGVSISFCFSAVAPTTGQVIQASYSWLDVDVDVDVDADVDVDVNADVNVDVNADAEEGFEVSGPH